MEAVIAVIVAVAPVAVVTVGNAEHALDRANGAADTGTNDTANRTAYGAGNPVTFIRAFLRAAHDALGVAGLR